MSAENDLERGGKWYSPLAEVFGGLYLLGAHNLAVNILGAVLIWDGLNK